MRTYTEWGEQKVIIDKIEPTHYVRNFLVKHTIKGLIKRHHIKNACEVGCGTGSLSIEIGKLGLTVNASDLDKNAVSLAQRFNNHPNVTYTTSDALTLKGKKQYDLLMTLEVLEHIKDDRGALKRMHTAIKQDGFLLLTVPIHEKYRKDFDERSGHIRRYDPSDLISKIKDAGFSINTVKHFNFPFLWVWYFLIYLPYSDRKEKNMVSSKESQKKLPKWIWVMSAINKLFLFDLLFNSRKFSTEMLVLARKQ
jgi:SAM-dependent methyltransferase